MRFRPFGWVGPAWMVRLPDGRQEGLWAAVYTLGGKADATKSRFELTDKAAAAEAAEDMRSHAEAAGWEVTR